MKTIHTTEIFDRGFSALHDRRAKARIEARLRRVEQGNFGDIKPVGEGVSELRIDYGPGYRGLFQVSNAKRAVQRGIEIVVLLTGGDKSTQDRDIKVALVLAKQV